MMVTDGAKKKQISLLEEPELKNLKLLYGIYAFLIITDYIMPQYFGLDVGVDITCTRFANIIIILYMMFNPKIFSHFFKTVAGCIYLWPLVVYLFVAGYTMVFRVDINAFFMVFMEILTFGMLIYGIRYVVGYRRTLNWSIKCAYFLSVYGVMEYAYGESLFLKFLATVPTAVVNFYRSGQYRIMGPCGHSLGYGLLLILLIALASIDIEKDEIFIFKRPVLIALLYLNVFLTGSRSTLGIAVLEFILLLIFSKGANVKKTLLYLLACIVALVVFILIFYETKIGQYILLQITSVIDQVFGTEYSVAFGAEIDRLEDSSEYRKYLPRIFTLDWLSPILGRGVSRGFSVEIDGIFIHSIDNYYVSQYIKYAYPGLFAYVIFIITVFAAMIKAIRRYKSGICKIILIATMCYFLNLWWLDALQTLKYEYILLGIFFAFCMAKRDEEKRKCIRGI